MRAPALQQANMGQEEHQLSGSNLSSSYSPPNLENKFLAQSSMVLPQPRTAPVQFAVQSPSCSSLQPSSLSSTSSLLFSSSSVSSSLSSPLLSTQNKLLITNSPYLSFPLSSSIANDSLISTHLASSALHSHFTNPPSFPRHCPNGQKRDDGGNREEMSEVMESCWEETTVHSEEESVVLEKDNTDSAMESPDVMLADQDLEERIIIRQEEFAVVEKGKETIEEDLKDKKYLLLNEVCCSLVNKNTAPGQKDWDSDDSVWTRIIKLGQDISVSDPQFLLKVAVYTRQELNIRITANFLLALAAHQPTTKPHVRRYYCAAVQLPSDWLEVVRIYSTCFSNVLPTCLKKAMADKFKQFTEYQLAKYNTRKHRCKHNHNRRKSKRPTDEQLTHWANLIRADVQILKTFMKLEDKKAVVDKKQSDFSMKKMIQRLHIKEPAEHVMAILGKKYPADAKTFIHSGMKGAWDRERAGQRMKLKEPVTWERLLSLEGNKAATWEKLIDNNSLPFVAMLRNLRNMITTGISEAHHKKILSRLSNKKAVIQSRQFPFRFLAAYKVIMQLRVLASEAQQALPPAKDILKGILKKIPKSSRFRAEWDTSPRKRIRVTRGVPYICRMYHMKKAQLLKANQRQYTVELLDRYCKALETAVQISCRYNVPPLPGRTIILLNSFIPTSVKQDFCLPPDPEEDENDDDEEKKTQKHRGNVEDEDELSASNLEVAILLSLMIASSAEDCQLYLIDWLSAEQLKLKSDVLLENVRSVKKQIKTLSEASKKTRDGNTLSSIFTKENKVDNIILLTGSYTSTELSWTMNSAKEIHSKALVVTLYMSEGDAEYTSDRNTVNLRCFSEQMLRFVAERGSSRLLDHVEHLDKVYTIPPPEGAKDLQTTSSIASIPTSPKLRWRGVRVFISSTFRDMHAERDMLVRSIFPELRRRAAPHCLYLQEVELRWGVTEEESGRATELCLSEVCRSQMIVGILGERYGLVPPKPALPDLPEYRWLASAPPGLSITEMEIRQFQALYPDATHKRMFCYFRDPNITKSVPAAWRSDFAPESMEAEAKMASLKSWIRASDVQVTEDYPCEWGGVVEAKPYLKNLENFGRAVLEDLWTAVVEQFVEEDDGYEAASDVTEQEIHQEALQRQFLGRMKLLSGAVGIVEQAQTKGGMMVVEGGPGDGKTVFMAALADALRTGVKSKRNLVCDVISYSTAASQSARSVENVLRCFIQWFRRRKYTEKEPLPHSYRDLLSEFRSTLRDVKKNKPLVLLVDGADLVQDGRGQVSSDWIPEQLPQSVCLVLSIQTKSALLQSLAKKRGSVLFTLGQLTVTDRKEIIQKGLDTFGKKLSDSAFNNQLQTLIMKSGAVSPLYLHLACEDLRNFASFDRLKESLQDLPQSLRELVKHSLDRLCLEYRRMAGLRWALAALTVSPTGLRERDLYSVLNTCNGLSSWDAQVSWQEVLNLSRKPGGRIPMATFTRLVQSLQSLVGPSHCHNTDDLLVLTNPEVRRAFEDFLLPAESDRNRAHLVLAAHLWAVADPQGTDTFLHCEVNSVWHLPSSLIQSEQLEALHSLLSSYFFMYANVRHGLLHHLLETYSLFEKKHQSRLSIDNRDGVKDCLSFLRRHAPLLSSWPALFIQQALNELPDTSAHSWAQGLVGKGGVRVTEWLNNDNQTVEEASELVSTFCSEPTCLLMSSDKELMVVGTGQGTMHFINTQTRQEVKALESSCDGISSCVFLMDGRLATTSFDGRIEIWDVGTSCRMALIEGHTNTITGSDVTADQKHFATVSLDFMLKVWSSAKHNQVAALLSSSPLNCVTFDPEGHLLAAGCWNGNVMVWNWLQNKTLPSLSGHQRSVRSLCFSSSSSMLCSGSVSGEIRVWSVPTATCVGCFQAHCGATQSLTFLDGGAMLLSAGSDHMLQLWSGGLGRSVTSLKSVDEPPLKKQKFVIPEPAALSVAVNGDSAAVGYHGDGIKVFSLDLGEKMWESGDLDVSILCLLWVLDAEQTGPDLLVCGGSDKHLSVWRGTGGEEGLFGGLKMLGKFGVQQGAILALAQNSTYLATASDDFSIVLWTLSDLRFDTSVEPQETLRGHSGGVTCLAFSPDGGQLLSGGKDQALVVWDVSSSPPVLSKSLRHCHRDWITGCVWTPDCVISSSNDGRLCLWDLQAGQRLKEISWRNPLTSVCCLGQYVMAGCAEGELHVWTWDTAIEICHIGAHKQRIRHCYLLPSTAKDKEDNQGEMTVFTASDDGTVQLWKPLQVEHFNTFLGHSGTINKVVCKEAVPEFLTVSEDCSLRNWTWTTKNHLSQRGAVSALSFSQTDGLLIVGYESGFLELWWKNRVVGHKQASGSSVTAVCFMPDDQFAVGYTKSCIDVWKLLWNQHHSKTSLVKVTTYKVEKPVVRLTYCSVLIGTYDNGTIFDFANLEDDWHHKVNNWQHEVRILDMIRKDNISMWLIGQGGGEIHLGFIISLGSQNGISSSFGSTTLTITEELKGSRITAATMDGEFVVCGDIKGHMWFNQPPELSSLSISKAAHSDRISALKLTDSTIISASYDRTVKLWDRNSKKQVGMFVCGGPVLVLEVNPEKPTELVCADGQGKLYFLSWRE